ncbi:MAG: UDP-N-acetylmuramoyl-L-alanyl-D-glutamate--2,6-diaminopimelate ligase [Rikenellaceae bacterium]
MILKELLATHVAVKEIVGCEDIAVKSLCYDSRAVERGGCFFAIVGTLSDGHDYIASAVERGAVAVVCERLPAECTDGVTYVVVESAQRAMSEMAACYYGHPSCELKLVGVTGTNGKTTTATLLADLFESLGYATGLISTVVYRVAGESYDSTHTTPDAIRLNAMLRQMVDSGCDYCFMEVSSHSVVQDRIHGLYFEGGVFTNLTHDHLDYHGTFAEYLRAKKRFFDGLGRDSFALINVDDRNGEVMVQNCAARVLRYSLRSGADFRAKVLEMHFDGMLMDLYDWQRGSCELWVRLLGRFNAYNLLTVYGVARALGVEGEEILAPLSALGCVSGRFEHIEAPEGRTVIIDYAHTPDALQKVLESISEIANGGGGAKARGVVVVCGCGGDRDREKRPKMGRIAYDGASTVIFTSDNPRGESPEAIIADMVAELPSGGGGAKRWLKVVDRGEAIRMAVVMSQPGDVILIAGKGHEKYQLVGGVRHEFDDHAHAAEAIKQYLS